MKERISYKALLEQIPRPAFMVKNNIIRFANVPALNQNIQVGCDVRTLLHNGLTEYEQMKKGRLYLLMNISDPPVQVSVLRQGGYDICILETDFIGPEYAALSSASQGLRNPLFNAMICADLLNSGALTQLNETQRMHFLELKRSLHQMHRAVCNMSDVSASQSLLSNRFENYNIQSVLEELLEKTKVYLSKTGKKFYYSIKLTTTYTMIHKDLLERGILNLISNAMKHSEPDMPITVRASNDTHSFKISITNTPSIQQQHYEKLFSMHLSETTVQDGQTGVGLGLTIARKAAGVHNGVLLVDKPKSTSVRFTLNFPIITPNADTFRSAPLRVDYSGGYDHVLTELADVLPPILFS